MLHFDLRTPDSAYDFILRMCKMTGQEFIEDFHVNCSADFEIFWEKHYSQLKSINSDRIKIYAFHKKYLLNFREQSKKAETGRYLILERKEPLKSG